MSTLQVANVHLESTGNNRIQYTGSNTFVLVAGGANTLTINSSALSSTGIYNTVVGGTNRDVFVDSLGVVGYVSSLRDTKTNIQYLTDYSWIYNLNVVSFNYRKKDENNLYTNEPDGNIQYGMIAEDVEQIRPDLCFYDEVNGNQELRGIQYSKLLPILLKAIQDQKNQIEHLREEIELLKK